MCDSLEADLRALYGAYEYLREQGPAAASTTARLLRAADLALLAARVADELAELRGAVAGTHGHGGGRDDIVLEAYQALYWLTLLAVAARDSYDDLRPHDCLERRDADAGSIWPDACAGTGDWHDATARRSALRGGYALVGALCRAGGINPHEAVRRDLAELRARPYLAAYWSTHHES